MRVGVERAVFGDGCLAQFGTGAFVAREGVEQHVAARTAAKSVDDALRFRKNQRRRFHETTEDDAAFDGEVIDARLGLIGDGGEDGRRFRRTGTVVGAVQQTILIDEDAGRVQTGDERRVQRHFAGEPQGRVAELLAAAHLDRVQQHRQRTAPPCRDADDQRQFRHTADALLGRLTVQHTSETALRCTKHAVVTEHRFQCHMTGREQLGHARRMRVRHVELGAELVDVLQRGRRQGGTVIVMPFLELVKHGLRTHVSDHFPTALR